MLSVVIPALNESENLAILLPRLREAFLTVSEPFEILLVDNGSSDDTARVVKDYAETWSSLRLLSEPTRGYGRAVLVGLREAKGDAIGIIRSDNQEKPRDLVRMFAYLREGDYHLVKAVRTHRMNEGLNRIVVSFVYNTLFKLAFGLRSHDLNASPKVFTRTFLNATQLQSLDFFIDAEMVIKAEYLGLSIGQMEIEYLQHLKGRSTVRLKHMFEFLNNMALWRIKLFQGRLFG